MSEALVRHGMYMRIILGFFCAAIFFAVGVSLYTYMIRGDFTLYGHISCDPLQEDCFAYTCEEASGECADMGEDRYFKVIYKSATRAPTCNPWSTFGCPELICREGESDCEVISCSVDTALDYQDGDSCW